MAEVLFFVLAVLMVAAALGVVLSRNPIRSALCLVATLFLLAVNFVLLDAHLVAALQVTVYAGAIMVLFLFVIMLLNLQTDPPDLGWGSQRAAAWLTGGMALLTLLLAVWRARAELAASDAALPAAFGTTAALSERLFTQYLLPFEITSLLLLVAIVGAVVLARRRVE